jgi:hypothetical protein
MTISSDKAKRATVAIGPLSVDGFQMPDGSYRMSPGLGQRPKKTAESLIQQGLRLCIAEQLFRPAKWAKFGQLAQAKEADI